MDLFNKLPKQISLDLNLDITTGIGTAFILALAGSILSFILGVRAIQRGRRITYYIKRQTVVGNGWRMILLSFFLAVASFLLNHFGEPAIYSIFPPSPTITLTYTITTTPTKTNTLTITPTRTITETPSITTTPAPPPSVLLPSENPLPKEFQSVFSPLLFTVKMDENNMPIETLENFNNPILSLYAFFSYDKMVPGYHLALVWYRTDDWVEICNEATIFSGSTGGYYSSQCHFDSPDVWLPGDYEVQLFVNEQWIHSGRFKVNGMPPTHTPTITISPTISLTPTRTITPTKTNTATATDTRTPSATLSPTITWTPSLTLSPTITRTPTNTLSPTLTRTPTETPTLSLTPTTTFTPTLSPTATATRTPRPTDTRMPTHTHTPTETDWPTITPRPTDTLRPIKTSSPTPTSVPTRSPTALATRTPRPTDTRMPTHTHTPTETDWPTITPRPTDTLRPTITLSK